MKTTCTYIQVHSGINGIDYYTFIRVSLSKKFTISKTFMALRYIGMSICLTSPQIHISMVNSSTKELHAAIQYKQTSFAGDKQANSYGILSIGLVITKIPY